MTKITEDKIVNVRFLRILKEKMGNSPATAELIGCSPTLINSAISSGQVRLVYELAAKSILQDLDEIQAQTDMVFILRISSEKVAGFETVCKAMGISLSKI